MNKMNGYKLSPDAQPLVVRYAETESEKMLRKLKNSGGSNGHNSASNSAVPRKQHSTNSAATAK